VGENDTGEIQHEAVWIGKGKGKSVARSTTAAINLPRPEKGSIDWGEDRFIWRKGLRRSKGDRVTVELASCKRGNTRLLRRKGDFWIFRRGKRKNELEG
jgi:hypothetical protein